MSQRCISLLTPGRVSSLYLLVSQLDEVVNLLWRDLRLELLLIDDDEELGPGNLAKSLRIKLIEYISPFIFE